MKLISLQLCNFRQFYGKTPLIFFASGQRNTTVIHGNNGAGKTTLLNAFIWILYEKFTPAFASPHLLVNKRAIVESDFNTYIECSATLEFEHDGKNYQLKRKFYAYHTQHKNIEYGASQLFMMTHSDDEGRWEHPVEPAEDIIEQILPESLHQYFFFDGEHIDHLSRREQKNSLAEDTKELIGIKVLDRAIEHVKKARKTLLDDLRKIGDIQIQKSLQELHKLENLQTDINLNIQQNQQLLKEQEESQKITNQKLVELSGAEKIQSQKLALEAEAKRLRENLKQVNQEIKNLLSTQAYIIFLESTFNKFQTILDKLKAEGKLSSNIKQSFVEQLLEQQKCICGRELLKDTEAYKLVEALTKQAGIAAVEETAIRLETKVNAVEQTVLDFWKKFDAAKLKANELREQLANNENQQDNLKDKLRNYPQADIQQLQSKLDVISMDVKKITLELGANQEQLKRIESEIATNQKQIDKHKAKEEKQALAKRRIQASEEVIKRLEAVKTRIEKQFRLCLEEKVQEIFSQISFTPYSPRLNENYELTLIENTAGYAVPVAASTGENQILSLSFIGGIIDRVRAWSQQNKLIGPDSSTFPIVMDSPFGSLDEIYRRQVAQSIPQLANQLVMMVTKTQWRGEVETEIKPYLGKEYVLLYHSSKADCEEDSITIDNQTYPLVQKSTNAFEYTEIIEVNPSGELNTNVVRY